MIERYTEPTMATVWSEVAKYQSWVDVELAVMRAQRDWLITPWTRGSDKDPYPPDGFIVAPEFVTMAKRHEEHCRHDVVAMTRTLAYVLENAGYGHAANLVHVGLTSSDVVDTALSLQVRKATNLIQVQAATLQDEILHKYAEAEGHQVVARTHGQRAEVMPAEHRYLVWSHALSRAQQAVRETSFRLCVAKVSGPTGAYSTWVTPEVEQHVAQTLQLPWPPASFQCLPRDLHAAYVTALAHMAGVLSSIATDIRLLSIEEVGEMQEGQALGQVGSSSMPHKVNPITAEKVCGLTRLVRGYASSMNETAAEMWLERDISNSSVERVALVDSTTLVHHMLTEMVGLFKRLYVHERLQSDRAQWHAGTYHEQNKEKIANAIPD